jgi:hypothetical protein
MTAQKYKFLKQWFGVCRKKLPKVRNIAIFKIFVKKHNNSNTTCSYAHDILL